MAGTDVPGEGEALVGRDLPEITADFRLAGLRLDWLEPRLQVPVQWIGADRIRQTVLDAYRLTLEAYGRTQPADLSAALEGKMKNGLVDFGDLDDPDSEISILVRRHRATVLNPELGNKPKVYYLEPR